MDRHEPAPGHRPRHRQGVLPAAPYSPAGAVRIGTPRRLRAGERVDVLVEFQPGHVPGLDFVSMEREVSGLLQGRRVDLVTPRMRDTSAHGTSAEVLMRDVEYYAVGGRVAVESLAGRAPAGG